METYRQTAFVSSKWFIKFAAKFDFIKLSKMELALDDDNKKYF